MEERFLRTGAIEPARRERETSLHPVVRMLLVGVARFAAFAAGAAAIAVGVALLIGTLVGAAHERSVPLGLYCGGALLVFSAALTSGTGITPDWVVDEVTAEELRRSRGVRWVNLALGMALIGLGIAADSLL